MRTLSVECSLVTPAITSQVGYDREGPLPRPAELRGQLRWAFRTVAASLLGEDELRRVETEFWGGRPSRNADLRPSPVSVRLRRGVDVKGDVEKGCACTRGTRFPVEVDGDGRLRVNNRCYLCPAIYLCPRQTPESRLPLVIRAGATFELELSGLEDDPVEVARRSLELLSLIGGYGRRFRRAFGCFEARFDDGTTRVGGTDDFVDSLRECLDGLRELILGASKDTSGPVETFPNLSDATLWTFEWSGYLGKLLGFLGSALRDVRRNLRYERLKGSNVELRWVLGSSPLGRSPGLLRSPLLLSVTSVDTRERHRGRYVVSILLLRLEKIRWEGGETRVTEDDRGRIEGVLDDVVPSRFRGVEKYSIEVTEDRARVRGNRAA
ncbi:RAMP superfamily CRISPR-associated protein [Methanopyrus sp.]